MNLHKLEALKDDRFIAFGLGTPGRQGEGHVIAVGSWEDMLTATPEYPLQDAVDAARAAQCRYEDAEKSGYFDALDPLPQPECGKLAVAHVGDLLCNGLFWLPQQLLMAIIDALLAEGPVVNLSDAAIAPAKIYGLEASNMRRDFMSLCTLRGANVRLVDDGKDGTLWALDDTTLETLWSMPFGGLGSAPPIAPRIPSVTSSRSRRDRVVWAKTLPKA